MRYFLLISILVILGIFSSIPHNAVGDGFTQENLPAATVGNRVVSVFVKINSIVNNGLSDTSRAGLARGNLVIPSTVNDQATVPEFGSMAGIVIVISLFGVLVINRKLSPV